MGNEILDSLKNSGNDVDGALRRFVGNESMYIKFLKRFLDDKSYLELKDAVEKNDIGNAFVAAHSLKGVAGNLGLTKLYDIASEVSDKLRVRSDFDLAADFASVTEQYDEAVRFITKL